MSVWISMLSYMLYFLKCCWIKLNNNGVFNYIQLKYLIQVQGNGRTAITKIVDSYMLYFLKCCWIKLNNNGVFNYIQLKYLIQVQGNGRTAITKIVDCDVRNFHHVFRSWNHEGFQFSVTRNAGVFFIGIMDTWIIYRAVYGTGICPW